MQLTENVEYIKTNEENKKMVRKIDNIKCLKNRFHNNEKLLIEAMFNHTYITLQ